MQKRERRTRMVLRGGKLREADQDLILDKFTLSATLVVRPRSLFTGVYVGDDAVCKQWIDSLYGGLLPYSHKKASYLNGIGENERAAANAFQENIERLVEIKKVYDPENRFRHNHNINPAK